jgi:hypothetical protein
MVNTPYVSMPQCTHWAEVQCLSAIARLFSKRIYLYVPGIAWLGVPGGIGGWLALQTADQAAQGNKFFKGTVGAQSIARLCQNLVNLSGEYLCPQKTQKAAGFFIRKIFGWRVN